MMTQKDPWMVRKGNEIKYKMIFPSPEAGLKINYIKKTLTKFKSFEISEGKGGG